MPTGLGHRRGVRSRSGTVRNDLGQLRRLLEHLHLDAQSRRGATARVKPPMPPPTTATRNSTALTPSSSRHAAGCFGSVFDWHTAFAFPWLALRLLPLGSRSPRRAGSFGLSSLSQDRTTYNLRLRTLVHHSVVKTEHKRILVALGSACPNLMVARRNAKDYRLPRQERVGPRGNSVRTVIRPGVYPIHSQSSGSGGV